MRTSKAASFFKRVSDITVPERLFQSLRTDNVDIDTVLSEIGGLIPSQVILVTGNPGSGKTTLCAVIGSRIAQRDKRPVVFLSYEMSDFQLKLQAKKMPGFDSLLISTHEFHAEAGGVADLFKALNSLNPSMVIVDSLQKMSSKMPEGPTRGQVVLVEAFTKWAKKTFTPVLLIGHNDKGGNYSGPSFLKHEVDSHLQVWFDKELQERMFGMDKNRFGGTADPCTFRIDRNGVHIGQEWWQKTEAAGDSAVLDMVAELRTASKGEKLSWEKFKPAAEGLIRMLNRKYAHRFAKDTFIGDPSRVKLTWTGKRACCTPMTGEINLGKAFFDTYLTEGHYDKVGYRSEKPFIKAYAKTKEEVALWVVLHEWCHLFKDCQKHTSRMWKEISKLAAQERWLFTA